METVDKIKGIIEPVLSDLGYELVDVQFRKESMGLVLRVIIYRNQGIGVDDCTLVSREVGYLLEVDDPISSAYTLEVSSPGLDRPLTTARDFERNIGKKIKLFFSDANGHEPVEGIIQSVEEGRTLHIKIDKNDLSIDLKEIRKAQLVIEF